MFSNGESLRIRENGLASEGEGLYRLENKAWTLKQVAYGLEKKGGLRRREVAG